MSADTPARTRYPDSVSPARSDGRDIDAALGTLQGEAAQQRAKRKPEQVEQLLSPAVDRSALSGRGIAQLLRSPDAQGIRLEHRYSALLLRRRRGRCGLEVGRGGATGATAASKACASSRPIAIGSGSRAPRSARPS